jgi:hypothetical protein
MYIYCEYILICTYVQRVYYNWYDDYLYTQVQDPVMYKEMNANQTMFNHNASDPCFLLC